MSNYTCVLPAKKIGKTWILDKNLLTKPSYFVKLIEGFAVHHLSMIQYDFEMVSYQVGSLIE